MARSGRGFLPAVLMALALLPGCGGGGGGSDPSATTTAPAAGANAAALSGANVLPISVSAGIGGTVNLAFGSVTLCAPGTASCQTIDNILIDTGSSGLRVLASALSATLALPQQADARGNPVGQCAHFVDGYTWGAVRIADVRIAGETANALPIQVIGDAKLPLVPNRCAATGPSKNSAASLRANGILGLAVFPQDCGDACVKSTSPGIYYSCPASGCVTTTMPLAQQLQNPVTLFATNNNGVIVELPAVAAGGATSASGSLVFGIGTQANNAIGGATVIGVDASTANFTTVYNGVSYSASFADSGSNAFFFADAGIPLCTDPSTAGFYCPTATRTLVATIQGRNGKSATVNFSVANVSALLAANPTYAALGNLGAPEIGATTFDWGLPFFYGRNVFVAISGASTPAGAGPYIAF